VTFNFAGKAALIIGGASGIGWSTARAFEDELRREGAPDALFLPLDVRNAAEVKRACPCAGAEGRPHRIVAARWGRAAR